MFTFRRLVKDFRLSFVHSVGLLAGLTVIASANPANAQIAPVQLTPATQTFAGTGVKGFAGDNGPALSAAFSSPNAMAADAAGNIYISDLVNNRIRRIDGKSGIVTTYAGNGTKGYSGDNGPAIEAELNLPTGLATDRFGNLFLAEAGNSRVREINAATEIITTVAGNGIDADTGDGGSAVNASIGHPCAIAFDASGELYIADSEFAVVRAVNVGVITTYAGQMNQAGYGGDGGPATNANLNGLQGLAVNAVGDLYIADSLNNAVRVVLKRNGNIFTLAGTGQPGYSGDFGPGYSASLNYPIGLSFDTLENLYIADALAIAPPRSLNSTTRSGFWFSLTAACW